MTDSGKMGAMRRSRLQAQGLTGCRFTRFVLRLWRVWDQIILVLEPQLHGKDEGKLLAFLTFVQVDICTRLPVPNMLVGIRYSQNLILGREPAFVGVHRNHDLRRGAFDIRLRKSIALDDLQRDHQQKNHDFPADRHHAACLLIVIKQAEHLPKKPTQKKQDISRAPICPKHVAGIRKPLLYLGCRLIVQKSPGVNTTHSRCCPCRRKSYQWVRTLLQRVEVVKIASRIPAMVGAVIACPVGRRATVRRLLAERCASSR